MILSLRKDMKSRKRSKRVSLAVVFRWIQPQREKIYADSAQRQVEARTIASFGLFESGLVDSQKYYVIH